MRRTTFLIAAFAAALSVVVPSARAVQNEEVHYPAVIKVCVNTRTQTMNAKRTCDESTEEQAAWPAGSTTPLLRTVCIRGDQTLGYSTEQECDSGTALNFTVQGSSSEYLYACVTGPTKILKRVANARQCSGRVLRWLLTKQEPATCANRGAACEVGDIGPGGGIVFYVDTEDDYSFTFLEAAKSNWYLGGDRTSYRGCTRRSGRLVRDTPTGIGTGETTTALLYGYCQSNPGYKDQPGFSPIDATGFVYKGLDDWFIPSKAEAEAMVTANATFAVGLRDDTYCTTHVIIENYGSGAVQSYLSITLESTWTYSSEGGQCLLRPVRAE